MSRPDHPAPDDGALPPRLADPLATARMFAWIGVLLFPVGLVLTSQGAQANNPVAVGSFAAQLIGLVLALFVVRTVPYRRVNAFYLRSFRRDDATTRVRRVIQQELGRSFRLSGIRNPQLRMPAFTRYAFDLVFCLRYATTRHMNLEAGDDWFARLWRSLGDARCAFLDLTDLTDYVLKEAELAYRCLGPSRVMFLGDPSRSPDEWQELVAGPIGLGPDEAVALRVVTWDRTAPGAPTELRQAVRTFAAQLPAGAAGVSREAYPLVASTPLEGRGPAVVGCFAGAMGLIGLPLLTVVLAKVLGSSVWPAAALAPAVLLNGWALYSFLAYLVDCGSYRERVITLLFLAVVAALALVMFGSFMMALWGVQDKYRHEKSANNLRVIGSALNAYESVHTHFPPARTAGSSGHYHSWRVLILPHIEQSALYQEYRFDEPWNGPNNRKLAGRMPDVYRRPGDDANAVTTPYMLLTGRGTAFEDPKRRRRLQDISDGASNTICVVEAPGKEVDWMKPDDLDVEEFLAQMAKIKSGQPLGLYRKGTNALFFDGTPRFLYATTTPESLRAWTTASGGDYADEP